jgi:hypothetical protein
MNEDVHTDTRETAMRENSFSLYFGDSSIEII